MEEAYLLIRSTLHTHISAQLYKRQADLVREIYSSKWFGKAAIFPTMKKEKTSVPTNSGIRFNGSHFTIASLFIQLVGAGKAMRWALVFKYLAGNVVSG